MTRPALAGFAVRIWRNIGFVIAGAVALFTLVHAFDPPRLNWGDTMSDYNVLTAGRNFERHGFVALRFTPMLIERSALTPADSMMIYTHYPQLPDLANGVFRTLFGISELWQFRLIALALSFASLFFVYRLVETYWSRQAAQVTIGLWAVNPMWLQHADYLHHGPYGAFFGFGSLYFLHRHFAGARRSLWLAGICLALAYLSSYDMWIFAPLLLAAMTVHHSRAALDARVVRTLAFLAAFAFAAIGLKLATNAWALGGMSAMLKDLHFQFRERATAEVVLTPFAAGVVPTLLGRIERFFSFLILPIAIYWAVAPTLRRRFSGLSDAGAPNPIVLLVAAIPFLLLFRELAVAYYYPTLMLIPFWAVGAAVIALRLLSASSRGARFGGGVLLAGLAFNSIDETWRFQKAFFPLEEIRSLQAQLRDAAPTGQRVLVNHLFDSSYRYYFDRDIASLIIHESYRLPLVLRQFSDPRLPQYATMQGSIFVQHKRVRDELFDKGYYHVLGRYQLWEAWGNPTRYRRFIDSLMVDRDSQLVTQVARLGRKVHETEYYTLWRLPPMNPTVIAPK